MSIKYETEHCYNKPQDYIRKRFKFPILKLNLNTLKLQKRNIKLLTQEHLIKKPHLKHTTM